MVFPILGFSLYRFQETTMLQNIRIIIAIALAAGIIWNCGGDRVTHSEIGTDEQIGRPLSKMAAQQNAVVIATVQQNDAPVSGAKVEFARSIAGQKPDYQWSNTTDENGRARIEITAGNGYYQARASQDGIEIGSWTSIPINAGDKVRLNLPIDGKAQLTLEGLPTEITIGIVLPLTGQLGAGGQLLISGFDLAREEINRSSLLGGAKINFIIEDNRSTPEGSVEAYNKLIHRDGVSVIIGPNTSSSTREAFPIAQQNEVVAISPTSASPGLSAMGDFLFRTSLTVNWLIPRGVTATHEQLGYQKVATIFQAGDVFAQSSDALIKETLLQNGVEVLITESFQVGQTDFSDQLTRIKESNPDAIFLSALPITEANDIMIQTRQIGIPPEVHFITQTLTPGEIERAGAAAEGAISFTAWTSTADIPRNRAFVENYTMIAGVEPSAFTAQSYATVHILSNAIANAQSVDSRAIRDALAHITNLDTILGKFSFDANGDAIYNPVILIVKNGKFEVFNP
ncbi:MAG: ABC transporter substrate-binding protein [Gemmatimonadetes bacterium]|nr:ABC transporter substrate-binding protein [Gemmatimonadota bacterium]